MVYAYGVKQEKVHVRNYAVKAGDTLSDTWDLNDFENGKFHLVVYGPNGFMREFIGDSTGSNLKLSTEYQVDKSKKATGNLVLKVSNLSAKPIDLKITDNAYKSAGQSTSVSASANATLVLNLEKNFNWYDFTVVTEENERNAIRFAGHVETGKESQSDPYMGQVV
jgi:phospholipase C